MYCKLPTNGKQLPAFPLEPVRGSNPGLRGGRRECYHSATVAPTSAVEAHAILAAVVVVDEVGHVTSLSGKSWWLIQIQL